MTKLYVGNLSYSMTDSTLADAFAAYGTVVSATIIMDRASGRSKGFGFVELEDDSAAQQAITEMNGKDVDGRKISVSVARPQEDRPRNNFRR
jgi:cold-inducible RNA-binding protein